MLVEKIMQTEQMQTLVKIANLSEAIPTSKKMVSVSSMLTKKDRERIELYSMGSIAVKVGTSAFFLSQEHKVPTEAIIQRNEQDEILGIPAIAGG